MARGNIYGQSNGGLSINDKALLIPDNIKKDINIHGVLGTLESAATESYTVEKNVINTEELSGSSIYTSILNMQKCKAFSIIPRVYNEEDNTSYIYGSTTDGDGLNPSSSNIVLKGSNGYITILRQYSSDYQIKKSYLINASGFLKPDGTWTIICTFYTDKYNEVRMTISQDIVLDGNIELCMYQYVRGIHNNPMSTVKFDGTINYII